METTNHQPRLIWLRVCVLLVSWFVLPVCISGATLLVSISLLMFRHGDSRSFTSLIGNENFHYLVSPIRKMDVRETPLMEIEAAGYQVLELEMRNLSLSSSQVQGVSFTSADCGAMSFDRFPICIAPLSVKKIRIMAARNFSITAVSKMIFTIWIPW